LGVRDAGGVLQIFHDLRACCDIRRRRLHGVLVELVSDTPEDRCRMMCLAPDVLRIQPVDLAHDVFDAGNPIISSGLQRKHEKIFGVLPRLPI
jgi:hypothetical protein